MKIKYFKGNKRILRSKRFCLKCQSMTHFKKKKNDVHSKCIVCGGYKATREEY